MKRIHTFDGEVRCADIKPPMLVAVLDTPTGHEAKLEHPRMPTFVNTKGWDVTAPLGMVSVLGEKVKRQVVSDGRLEKRR